MNGTPLYALVDGKSDSGDLLGGWRVVLVNKSAINELFGANGVTLDGEDEFKITVVAVPKKGYGVGVRSEIIDGLRKIAAIANSNNLGDPGRRIENIALGCISLFDQP